MPLHTKQIENTFRNMKQFKSNSENFHRQFIWLIAISWLVPPVIGFFFINYLELFSNEQIKTILTTPLESIFIISTLIAAIIYFRQYARPLTIYLDTNNKVDSDLALKRLRNFPLHFWGSFLTYLLIAPSTVILSAILYTGFQPQPIDWFRIHLVALIVSITVGLPIFFMFFDLFGKYFGSLAHTRPILRIRTKVFLIGALIPLLIDTMIVQYYWSKTGYFTYETLFVWLILELLAIAGSLLFVKSFGQSLHPLEGLLEQPETEYNTSYLPDAESTDELGVLTQRYNKLIHSLKTQNRILTINNKLLRHIDDANQINTALTQLFDIAQSVTLDNNAWIFLDDPARQQLVCLAQHNSEYALDGIFSMPYPDALPLNKVAQNNEKFIIENLEHPLIYQSDGIERLRLKRAIALPLKVQGENIGLYLTGHSNSSTPYLSGTVELLESICHEVAIAIHTQRLREHTHSIQEKSEELNSNIRTLIDSTSEGIIAVDTDMNCTFINKAAETLTGWKSKEVLGENIHQLLQHSHEDKSPFQIKYSFIKRAIQENQTYQGNNQVIWRKNETTFPVQLSCSPFEDRNKEIGAVVIFRDITHERAISRKVDFLASHDTLTNLINRHEFENRLQQAIYNLQIERSEHVLCYIDLDQFKVVNDTCGHIAGDELLRQLGNLLQAKIRQGDTLARLGGDEFGILFLHCELEHAINNISAIQELISDYRFSWEQKTFAVGASIGVVTINRNTRDITQALSAADTACYIAKESGRNRIHVYREDDFDVAKRYGEMEWVSRIHDAIDNNGFMLNIQKIVPVASHSQDHHFEVLLTMRDGTATPIPPGAFIPAAERYNLMTFIDRWVLKSTFEWLSQNREHLDTLDLCAINLSGQTIGDPNFTTFLKELFDEHNIPPQKICFEITETAAVANMSRASVIINELKKNGCRFSLDDFGSGMSSFSYLKNLPVDFLKIDGNFVKDIIEDPIDRSMVQAITQVAQVMNLETIAEFVEKPEIMDLLYSIGVDYAQGYAIEKPIPIENFDWHQNKSKQKAS